jgi:hypothetical protein
MNNFIVKFFSLNNPPKKNTKLTANMMYIKKIDDEK